jgi:protein-S-isoprenylcysteine O-methyltransferase Ste14
MRFLELKIPPVVLTLLAGAGVANLAATAAWAFAGPRPLGGLFVAAGAFVAALGVVEFRRWNTTIDPRKPAAAGVLVTSGIYRWTRNPMYLGLLALLTGWGVVLGNAAALLVVAGFAGYLTRFQIVPEERALAERFPAEFAAYRARVRRWC